MNNIDLTEAINLANKPNYLGNPETVHYLIRDFAARAIKRVDPDDKTQAWAHADIADCVRLANIFLGKDREFAPMPKWNEPGIIDAFAQREMNLQGDSQQIMGAVFLEFIKDVYRLYKIAVEGAPDESWTFQVDAICDGYAKILLGIKEPTE